MLKKLFCLARAYIMLLRQVKRIRKGQKVGISRAELAKAQINVGCRSIRNKYFKTKAPSPIEICGFKLNYIWDFSFELLFNEIFLKEHYYFNTKEDRPFIIDCGSNIGFSIFYFKKIYPKARILGFEPFSTAYEVLRQNIAENGLKDVTVENLALAGSSGVQNLFYNPSKPGGLRMSLLERRADEAVPTVAKTTILSDFVQQKVDFLKMDIEGLELDVLRELDEKKKLGLIEEMAIEYHHHIDAYVDCLSEILHILERNNFGYQLDCGFGKTSAREVRFQDIMIYAYAKPRKET